jgi:uncharacterized protein YndB with AHSA1/START domain
VVAQRRPPAAAGRGRGAQAIEELIEEQRIAASPDTVFSYLVDPEKFVLWMGREARIDPRPGGVFRLDVDGTHVASGRYEVVDPPRRVVFSFGWEGSEDVPPGSTRVEITLEPDGPATLLRLRHSELPSETQRVSHRAGWRQYLGSLAITAGR